jgi:hypothetical protein
MRDKLINKTTDVLQKIANDMGLNPDRVSHIKRIKAVIDGRGTFIRKVMDNPADYNVEVNDLGIRQVVIRLSGIGTFKPKGAKLYTRDRVKNRKKVLTINNDTQ